MVSRHDHDLTAAADRPTDGLQHRTCGSERVAERAVPELEQISQQDYAVAPAHRVQQCGERRLCAQDVDAGARA